MMKTVRISMKKKTILEEMFFGLCKASAITIVVIMMMMIVTTTTTTTTTTTC